MTGSEESKLTTLRQMISAIVLMSLVNEKDLSSKVPCDAECSDSVCEPTRDGLPTWNLKC